MLIDFFALGAGVIWGTNVLADEDARMCAAEDREVNRFRIILLINVILGYAYLALLVLCFCCLGCCACVLFKMDSERRQQVIEQNLNRAPRAAQAMKGLKKKDYGELDKEHQANIESCCICFENF